MNFEYFLSGKVCEGVEGSLSKTRFFDYLEYTSLFDSLCKCKIILVVSQSGKSRREFVSKITQVAPKNEQHEKVGIAFTIVPEMKSRGHVLIVDVSPVILQTPVTLHFFLSNCSVLCYLDGPMSTLLQKIVVAAHTTFKDLIFMWVLSDKGGDVKDFVIKNKHQKRTVREIAEQYLHNIVLKKNQKNAQMITNVFPNFALMTGEKWIPFLKAFHLNRERVFSIAYYFDKFSEFVGDYNRDRNVVRSVGKENETPIIHVDDSPVAVEDSKSTAPNKQFIVTDQGVINESSFTSPKLKTRKNVQSDLDEEKEMKKLIEEEKKLLQLEMEEKERLMRERLRLEAEENDRRLKEASEKVQSEENERLRVLKEEVERKKLEDEERKLREAAEKVQLEENELRILKEKEENDRKKLEEEERKLKEAAENFQREENELRILKEKEETERKKCEEEERELKEMEIKALEELKDILFDFPEPKAIDEGGEDEQLQGFQPIPKKKKKKKKKKRAGKRKKKRRSRKLSKTASTPPPKSGKYKTAKQNLNRSWGSGVETIDEELQGKQEPSLDDINDQLKDFYKDYATSQKEEEKEEEKFEEPEPEEQTKKIDTEEKFNEMFEKLEPPTESLELKSSVVYQYYRFVDKKRAEGMDDAQFMAILQSFKEESLDLSEIMKKKGHFMIRVMKDNPMLKYLNLSSNGLTDAMFEDIYPAVQYLVGMNLSHNKLRNLFPLADLNRFITDLCVSHNSLTDKGLKEILDRFVLLEKLDISYNNRTLSLTGVNYLSSKVMNRPKLKVLNIEGVLNYDDFDTVHDITRYKAAIKTLFRNLRKNRSLRKLNIGSSQFRQSALKSFGRYVSKCMLREINLTKNMLTGARLRMVIGPLKKNQRLRKIHLCDNDMEDTDLKLILSLLKVKRLNELCLASNKITDVGIVSEFIDSIPNGGKLNVKKLDLSFCKVKDREKVKKLFQRKHEKTVVNI